MSSLVELAGFQLAGGELNNHVAKFLLTALVELRVSYAGLAIRVVLDL